jgi:MAE_28990/MAE_18760-like HEPN
MTEDEFLVNVTDELDRRREAVTRVKRVVAQVRGTTLEQTAAVMAIPVLYAHWEGFVKQAVGTYVEFVESQAMLPHQANAGIFAFSIKKKIRGLIHNQSAAKMTEFAGWLIKIARDPLTQVPQFRFERL